MDVVRGVREDEVAVRLDLSAKHPARELEEGYLWKAIPIKKKRMQELPRSERHKHPAPHPPRFVSKPAVIFQRVVRELRGSSDHIYGNGDA